MSRDVLTVVVAAFNEEEAIPGLHARIRPVLDSLDGIQGRVLYVDDGSQDGTWQVLRKIAAADPCTSLVRLSRNYGKEAALTAGLDLVGDGAIVIIDADGQDPPELIPRFVELWRQGYDNVYGSRMSREGETVLKRATASVFYRVMKLLSPTPVPVDTGDFRLLSPRAVAALGQLRERTRFMKGLFGWVGFRQIAVPYHRDPRRRGASKFGFWRLWNFALDGITSFSTVPLRLATYVGFATSCMAFLFSAWVIIKALLWGDPVAGWPTMMAIILMLGGVQLIAIGLIGEYLGRLYEESKGRPLYIVEDFVGSPSTFGAGE